MRKINSKILLIHPFISVAFQEVSYLTAQIQNGALILLVGLKNGTVVPVPSLSEKEILSAFLAHEQHVEEMGLQKAAFFHKLSRATPIDGAIATDLPSLSFQLSDLGTLPLNGHDDSMKDAPPLPKDVIEKVSLVARTLGGDLFEQIEFVPNCNCFFCQIARSIKEDLARMKGEEEQIEEEPEAPLSKEWVITEIGDHLFRVSHHTDSSQVYTVSLKGQIQCSCGQERCLHIRAVLES